MIKTKCPKSILSAVIFGCLLMCYSSQNASAQGKPKDPPPENQQLKELKEQNEILAEQKKAIEAQKAIAEAEKGIAEANKAKFNAEFPKTSATPLEGKTEMEGVKIESEMMAYRALKSAAQKIAAEVTEKTTNKKVAILNDQWLMGIRDYWATKNKLKLMRESYIKILELPQPLIAKVPSFRDTGVIGSIYKKPDNTLAELKVEKFNKNTNKSKKSKRVITLGLVTDFQTFNESNMFASEDDNSGEAQDRNSFGTAVGAITSTFGMTGSLVGAAIDLMALARTDTKITGFTFTPQESALVSEVYKKLSASSRFYPAEFSPNVNLQKQFAIVTEIQGVGDLKDRAEQLIISIDETEKIYQEAIATKATLEARQKQLPLDIASLEKKINNLQTIKKKTTELETKIVELKEKLDEFKEEKEVGLPKKIEKNAAEISRLEIRLSQLYSHIKPIASVGIVVKSFLGIGDELDRVAMGDGTKNGLLGRSYTFEEIEKLSKGEKDIKKTLIADAERKLGRTLSVEEKNQLLNPYDLDRLKVFVKIGNYLRSNPRPLSQLEPWLFLSDVELLKLIHPLDDVFLTEKNKLSKERGINLIKLRSLNKQFDKFYEDVTKSDSTLGINPITKHLQIENMMDAFGCSTTSGECNDTRALVLKVIDVGGNNRVKKNLLTMAVTGADISHSGGAIVEYKLYDMNGNVLNSSICTAYEPYRKAKNINQGENGGLSIAKCELISETRPTIPEAQTRRP